MGTRCRNCDLHRSTTVVIEYMSSDLDSEHTRAGLVAQIAARTIKTGPPGVVNCDLQLGTSDSGTFDRKAHRRATMDGRASCGCVLAGPANLLGLGVLHSSLCMKHAEARFCLPVDGSALSKVFVVRAESNGAVEAKREARREQARQEAVVEAAAWSSSPPQLSRSAVMRSVNLKWEMQRRLSGP